MSSEDVIIRSWEGMPGGQQQRCQSSEALAEWRSSEQLENGTPSTSPPYWDTEDDADCGMIFCLHMYLSLLFLYT